MWKLVSLSLLSLSVFFFSVTEAVQWSADTFPNPLSNGYRVCRMDAIANICDPDAVLSEKARKDLEREIVNLERRTSQMGRDLCEQKGLSAGVALMRRLRGSSQQDAKEMANKLLYTWDLDSRCKKAIVVVLAVEDRAFWVARDDRVPLFADQLTSLFDSQGDIFVHQNYSLGISQVLDLITRSVLAEAPVKPKRSEQKECRGTTESWLSILLLVVLVAVFSMAATTCLFAFWWCHCANGAPSIDSRKSLSTRIRDFVNAKGLHRRPPLDAYHQTLPMVIDRHDDKVYKPTTEPLSPARLDESVSLKSSGCGGA